MSLQSFSSTGGGYSLNPPMERAKLELGFKSEIMFVKEKNPKRNLLEAINVTKIFQQNLAGVETENSSNQKQHSKLDFRVFCSQRITKLMEH